MNVISLSLLRNGKAKCEPKQYLGTEWNRYLEASRKVGASYDATVKAQVCVIETVPILVESLRTSGFDVSITPELEAKVRALAREIKDRIGAAQVRIESIREELRKKNLELYRFQESGVEWLSSRDKGLLADEMGLGKTIMALTALPKNPAVVVICPAAVKGSPRSASGWCGETRKWRGDIAPSIMSGRGVFKWPRPGEMTITNYDILPDLYEEPPLEPKDGDLFGGRSERGTCSPGTIIIADEAHLLKNKDTKRTKRFRALAKEVWALGGRAWLMTGTPLLNRPMELWNILEAGDMHTEAFGGFGIFLRAFRGYRGAWGGLEFGAPDTEKIVPLLKKVMMARRREEVLPDLPRKIWESVGVEIGQDVRDAVNRALVDAGLDATQEIEKIISGSQNGVAFEAMSRVRAVLAEAKIPQLLEMVEVYEESGEPVVVFSDHKKPVDTLGAREGWAKITGDTPNANRSEIVDSFQAGKLKGLAVTIAAGGVGITLTRAHQAIFVDMNWTPGINKQAEDRLCRIGQSSGVVIKRMVAEHFIDQRMTEILAEKQALIEGSVDAARTNAKHETLADTIHKMEGIGQAAAPVSNPSSPTKIKPASLPVSPTLNSASRGPESEDERWAASALLVVAGLDPDKAREQNGVGFSKLDGEFGHSLADRLRETGRLTGRQWFYCVRLVKKYHRQMGPPPGESCAPKNKTEEEK